MLEAVDLAYVDENGEIVMLENGPMSTIPFDDPYPYYKVSYFCFRTKLLKFDFKED